MFTSDFLCFKKSPHRWPSHVDSAWKNGFLQKRLSADEKRDESTNRTSSVLHALITMATTSSVLEKKTTFCFLALISGKNFDVQLVKKVPDLLGTEQQRSGRACVQVS